MPVSQALAAYQPAPGFPQTPAPEYWNAPRAVAFSDSPVAAADRDWLLVDTSGGAITVNLPPFGRVWITDVSGNAATNNITVTPRGTDTTTCGTIDLNYFSAVYVRNDTNWDIS